MYRQELLFWCSAGHLMMIYISIKFFWKYLERFSRYRADIKLQLSNLKGWLTPKCLECTCMSSARRLIILYISITFHENILNGFQVIERTGLRDGRTDRRSGHEFTNVEFQREIQRNSKTVRTRLTVLVFCTSSDDALYFCEASWKYLERFSGYRADKIAWRTERKTERTRIYHCRISKGYN